MTEVPGFDWGAMFQSAMNWESDQEQEGVLDCLAEWWAQGLSQAITLGGYAGTGKTRIIARIAARLGIPPGMTGYCAPTGKAADVLEKRLEREGLTAEVSTIHSLLYAPLECHRCGCGRCGKHGEMVPADTCSQPLRNRRGHVIVDVTYVMSGSSPGFSLIIADEASMIGRTEWENLCSLGIRIIAAGDHGQNRPVKSAFSLMRDPDLRLEIVRRQAAGDPIIAMATLARTSGWIPHGVYGPLARKITPAQAQGAACARWEPGTLMIAARRVTARRLNEWARAGHVPPGTVLAVGDQVICLRNSKKTGIRNGQVFLVREITDDDGGRISFSTECGRELIAAVAQFGEDELLAPSETPAGAGLFGYGYAITCHKAQGSEADRVIVVEEDWPRADGDRRRWLYTACTRARRELTVIGP